MKKVLMFVAIFCLVAQGAMAAGPMQKGVVTPNQPVRYTMKLFFEGVREKLAVNPEKKVGLMLRHAGERLKELEALAETDPEALKEKLLARHDAIVKRAEEIVANKASLPETIVTRLAESQVKALEIATEKAKGATDPEIAEKRLNALKARQELALATVEKNAEKIAGEMIKRAEAVLSNSAELRARIEKGEGLEVIKERHAERMQKAKERRENFKKKQGGK